MRSNKFEVDEKILWCVDQWATFSPALIDALY